MSAHVFANVYLRTKIFQREDGDCVVQEDPCGRLYSHGILPTSVTELDLPPWYVSGWLPSRCLEGLDARFATFRQDGRMRPKRLDRVFGYVSALGVKELFYIPWYMGEESSFALDSLFISYDKPIRVIYEEGDVRVDGHDCVLSGAIVVPFVHAVAKYGDCCVDPVLQELERKADWRLAGAHPHCERVRVSTRTGVQREWIPVERQLGSP